ncbi:hypothetical protein [Aeromicrobium wangtongii]|uniref:Uncharacterized protein n=1 Tax=Aeromicrobium wangtongii TaxID=2969247 RepID=A0ABY5MAL3_9ACTN|nr:hypothetical protein [Aeromicrobium wangtongii]MCD9196975.1 hypothetical protein [Aeromicrobium wangtongii]UUP14477.1 hypothetical protein NQV15_03965 [Aeromicrobium wangtongii]
MVWPWWFAGKRRIATAELKRIRQPAVSDLVDPITTGTFLHTYLISSGQIDDAEYYAVGAVERLAADGRMRDSSDRVHVYSHFCDCLGVGYAKGFEPRDVHALNYLFGYAVLEVVDAPSVEGKEALGHWLRSQHLPQKLQSGMSMCLLFSPRPPT